MLSNLRAEIARRGLRNRAVSDHLKISEAAFSNRMTGRQAFSGGERAALSHFLGVGETELFSDDARSSRLATPIADLFRLIDETLANFGNPAFILAKFQRMEAPASYEACCAHVFSVLRRQRSIPATMAALHWVVTWDQGRNGFLIENHPPRRADGDTLQEAGSTVIHPILRAAWPPARENTANFPQGERR